MIKEIRVRLLSEIRKKDTDTWIQKILKGGLVIILLPFIFAFGLLIMFFVLVVSIFQKREKPKKAKPMGHNESWIILVEIDGVKVWQKYNGEIRFGPAYFDLKTEPEIEGLNHKIFGEWFFIYGQRIFLQQWNSYDTPDTSLVYLDTKDQRLTTLKDSIDSLLWEIIVLDKNKLELKCDTGYGISTYILDL